MTTEEEDPVMRMYEAQASLIEKEAEIKELRKRIEELERERLERNQGEPTSSSRELWAELSTIEERLEKSDTRQQQRVEESERRLEESVSRIETQKLEETEIIKIIRIIHDRVTALEDTDKFDRMERRLEEIVARLDRNETENLKKGMEELEAANSNLLERMTTLEDRIKRGNDTILIVGGKSGFFEDLDEMVILDRKTSTWKVLNLKLPCKNRRGGSVLLNGKIYTFGGTKLKKKLYKLDSQQMKWIKLAEMNEDRRRISNSSLVFQGCIWVFGGWKTNEGALDTVEKYCPKRNRWIKMPGMSGKRSFAAAAVCNEKVFVSGGHDGRTNVRSVECFDPTSRVWTPMVDMPDIREGHSMISDGSNLFVMGGFNKKKYFKTVWRIRPSEENAVWKELQPMNMPRGNFTAKSLWGFTSEYKKEIYAIGGYNGLTMDSVEIFDGERWRHSSKLPNRCDSISSVVIPSSLAETLLQC